MNVDKDVIKAAAYGRWDDIYRALIPDLASALSHPKKHHPCPFHNGKDGFRFFKDYKETGGCICGTCGNFTGINLLMFANNWDFPQALNEINYVLGNPSPIDVADKQYSYAVPEMTEEEKIANRDNLAKLMKGSLSLNQAGAARGVEYLSYRKLQPKINDLIDLRFGKADYYEEVEGKPDDMAKYIGTFPALLGIVRSPEGKAISVHRTYLDPKGSGRPNLDETKKLMPKADSLIGAAIRLAPVYLDGEVAHVGIAEGIETALAATQLYGIPTWSAISASLLANFCPPKGITHVTIFADKDVSKAGENAAKALYNNLTEKEYVVNIIYPSMPIPAGKKSVDFADVLEILEAKMAEGAFDLSVVDTEPGSESGPFSPPVAYKGNGADFINLMRQRYTKERHHAQQMQIIAMRLNCLDYRTTFVGPFAEEAKEIVMRLNHNSKQRASSAA